MPIDTRDWYREKYGDKPPSGHRPYRPSGGRPSSSKVFLTFLVIACIAATVYTGYLLFSDQTNWIVGAIVFAADVGVLIWNISALRKWRVGIGTALSILLVIAFLGATACALGGVEPFSSARDKVTSWFQSGTSEPTHELSNSTQYFVERELTGLDRNYVPQYRDIYMELTTVAYWEKDTSESRILWSHPVTGTKYTEWIIEFEAHQAQWVINWYYKPRASTPLDPTGYEPTLNLVVWPKATFDRYFWTMDRGLIEVGIVVDADNRGVSDKGVHCTVVHQAGDYVIVITPSAFEDIPDWWVKVGVE
jgi:hypothetical protein